MQLQSQVNSIIEKVIPGFRSTNVENSTKLSELGFDSLHKIELAVALEDEFGFGVSDADAENLQAYGDIIELVNMRILNPAS